MMEMTWIEFPTLVIDVNAADLPSPQAPADCATEVLATAVPRATSSDINKEF